MNYEYLGNYNNNNQVQLNEINDVFDFIGYALLQLPDLISFMAMSVKNRS